MWLPLRGALKRRTLPGNAPGYSDSPSAVKAARGESGAKDGTDTSPLSAAPPPGRRGVTPGV
jgi:hypothetical protein